MSAPQRHGCISEDILLIEVLGIRGVAHHEWPLSLGFSTRKGYDLAPTVLVELCLGSSENVTDNPNALTSGNPVNIAQALKLQPLLTIQQTHVVRPSCTDVVILRNLT